MTGLCIYQDLVSINQAFCIGSNKEPTAIVVDADTGEPIEGAVAIAIWRKDLGNYSWFEGGVEEPVRIEEVLSDKDGKIYIDDFLGWHFAKGHYPRLTVYKFGYVCWDQKKIFNTPGYRNDFDNEHRVVRMKKWPEGFSFNKHESFVSAVTGYGDLHDARKKIFPEAFQKETSYRVQERNRRDKMRKNEKGRN